MLGYVLSQLARRLASPDEDARQKAGRWQTLLENLSRLEVGSRTPVADLPAWVTLEVLTGGFATGNAMAAGGAERNAHYMSEAGTQELRQRLADGCYQLDLPEEGAWLVLAWLEQNGHLEAAAGLLETLLPYTGQLRFYPAPREQPVLQDLKVHLRTVAEVRERLDAIQPNSRILAQKEAIEVWALLYDQLVALFQETVQEGEACRVFARDWDERSQRWQESYREKRRLHRLCGRPEKRKHPFAQLRLLLEAGPRSLGQPQRARIAEILRLSQKKRPQLEELRQKQLRAVQAPTHQQMARLLSDRLSAYPAQEGVGDLEPVRQPTGEGYPIPAALLEKVERCLHASLEELVESGRIPSGEVLAKILPQLTSQLRAAEFQDPALGRLYAAIYRAFRQRRSLLLLDLQSQVRLEELPWVQAIESFRVQTNTCQLVALQSLTRAALNAFPQAILPNKLIREMRALAGGAQLNIPFTDELAADIFMGRFAPHYSRAAQEAQEFLRGSLYQTYYSIQPGSFENLAEVCQGRAGVKTGRPAQNGQILEQQQILTTHNLAALFRYVSPQVQSDQLALECFRWICRRLQIPQKNWHDQLLTVKNGAYAWRQMIFFLSRAECSQAFFAQAGALLKSQTHAFQRRFEPAWQGLLEASLGRTPDQVWYGWSQGRHWLLD